MARYRQTLPAAQAKRPRLTVGWTDLYLIDTADLIEAKRSPGTAMSAKRSASSLTTPPTAHNPSTG